MFVNKGELIETQHKEQKWAARVTMTLFRVASLSFSLSLCAYACVCEFMRAIVCIGVVSVCVF